MQRLTSKDTDEEPARTVVDISDMFGEVTSFCYLKETAHSKAAIGFGTSKGFINFVLSIGQDLTRYYSAVESYRKLQEDKKTENVKQIISMTALTIEDNESD